MNWYKIKSYLINLTEITLIETQENYINFHYSKINNVKSIYFDDVGEALHYFNMISDELLRHQTNKEMI